MRWNSVFLINFAAAGALLISERAEAFLVRWDVEGAFGIVVPPVPAPLSGLSEDDRVVVSITFDTDTPPQSLTSGKVEQFARYLLDPIAFEISFPDLGLELTAEELVGGTPEFELNIGDNTDKVNPEPEDIIAISVQRASGATAGAGSTGVEFTWAGLAPVDFLSSPAIPGEFTTSDFSATQIVLSDADDATFRGGGTLSRFTSTIVPTPGSALVFVPCVGALRMRRRR